MCHLRSVLLCVTACVLSNCLLVEAASEPARPQQSAETNNETAGQSEDSGPSRRPARNILEEIIVTATRRDSVLQDTALSVGVQTARDLAEMRAVNLKDYWRLIPSLVVTDSGPFGTRVAIRGLSGNSSARADESLTAIYLDDTPITNPEGFFTSAPDFDLVDVNRVEVLRGPQGTLFGASTMGGALRTITNRPDATASTQFYEATISGTNHGGTNYDFNAVLNQPLVRNRSALRLVAYYRNADGYIDDIGLNRTNVNSNETLGFRLSGNAKIGDKLLFTGKIQYQDVKVGSYNEVDPVGKPEIGLAIEDDYQLALLLEESRSDEVVLYNLNVEYTTPWADWISVTSYFENESEYIIDIGDEMNTFFGTYLVAPIDGRFTQKVFTQEFRVTSNAEGRFGWLAGFFYLDQETPREEIVSAAGFNDTPFCQGVDPPPPPNAPYPTCSGFPDGEEILAEEQLQSIREDYGVFGEVSYQLAERWEGTVGARWYQISKRTSGLSSGFFVGGFDIVTDVGSDEDGVNAKGSLAYRVNEDAMVYVLASQGFRPGGANDPSVVGVCENAPLTYESDNLWNYELGARTSWLGNHLILNGTVYHIDWSDAQIIVFSQACNLSFVDNSGEATSDGIEVEVSAVINDHWELALNAGYVNATLKEAIPNPDVNAPTGTNLPNVPDVTASLVSTHHFPTFGNYEGFVRADVQYTGHSFSDIDLNVRVKNPSYILVNLRAGIETGQWRTELYVENMFNEQAILFCCRLNGEFVTNRPRTIGLRVSYRN